MELSNKKIVKTKVFNQSLVKLWWRWTTHEGLKTFFGSDNKISLYPNGEFEIYFILNNPIGKKGSEGCKILSYLPEKYLSFSWNAPPEFEAIRSLDYKTWVCIEFKAISSNQSELILTHLGWPLDDSFNPVFNYFDNAWDIVFASLSKFDTKQVALILYQKVTGIGGIFFKCKNPEKVKDWYKTFLGLDTDKYGTTFEWIQSSNPDKKGFTQWSTFSENSKYFDPSTKDFMINYRVDNLIELVAKLSSSGVTILDKIESFDYGKFVHVLDVEGNKIELWEPFDSEYDKIIDGRTK